MSGWNGLAHGGVMLARILPGIVIYGALAVFVYLLARMSIRYEMSKHPDPPYHVALPFLKTMYFPCCHLSFKKDHFPASRVARWALLPTSPLRTVRESCPFIRLKPLPGTFPHPASLRLTAGDVPVCDNWGGEGASWRDCPCHRRPDREYDERAIHSLW